MTDAAHIFSSTAGHAALQPISRTAFSFGRICRTLSNSLTRLSSNHRLPRSAPEVVRQSLSNLNSYFASLIRASSYGMERPVLAAAQLLLHWSFCQLQQRALDQAHSELPRLLLTTSDNAELNEELYALNQLMLSASTAEGASVALQRVEEHVADREAWLNSLTKEDRHLYRKFEQKLKGCLEKMAFWQPRSTLMLPLINALAPYVSVYLDTTLPTLGASSATTAPGQMLNASSVIIGDTSPAAELWFKSIINLPADISLPPLLLRQGQSVCLRIPKCPSDRVNRFDNQTSEIEIAGVGIEGNLATRVCVSNNNGLDLEVGRELNTATTGYSSALYRLPLQIDGASEPINSGTCPAANAARKTLAAPLLGWNLLPVAGAQDIQAEVIDENDLDPFGPMAGFDEWPFYDYGETTTAQAVSSTPMLSAEQVDYALNLFDRNKRVLILYPFTFPRNPPTTAALPGSTTPLPAVTQDSLTLLFGPSETAKPQGSCRIKRPPLIARDLDDMLVQAQQWLSQIPATQIEDKLHVYLLTLPGSVTSQLTPLEKIAIIIRKLVINHNQDCAYDESEAVKFATSLFERSPFANNKELLNAWVQAPEGKHHLTDILLYEIDRLIPDPGKLLSATFNTILAMVKPVSTKFSALENLVIDLQNGFKNNLLASVINADEALPAFLESEVIIEKMQFLHLEFIKNHLPCFRLINKDDVSDEAVLSTNGVLLTVAAGIIANDNKLNLLTAEKLKKFGMQSLLRFSDDYLLRKFSRYDDLLKKSTYRLSDYLNHLEVEGRLLVHALYLNHKIYHDLQQYREQITHLKSDYQALADVEKQLCRLAFEQIPAVDQDFFLFASQEPQGLEVYFITSQNASESVKNRHFIGFIVTADFERIRRCYFISEIPVLNNFAAPLAYDDSAHFHTRDHYANWLNQQGKTAFVARLSAQGVNQLAQTTFFVSDKKTVPAANERESWQIYMQRLSQSIINIRFPEITTVTTSSPGTWDVVVDFSENLATQFIPVESCKQALNDITAGPGTLKKALLTLEDAAICLYDATPEGEGSKLVRLFAAVARSVVGKIAENIRKETKHASSQVSLNPTDASHVKEQMYLEDSQVRNYLANSTLFNTDLGWMLHNNSLNIRQLPAQIKILDVRWNMLTDQIYCKTNGPQGIKNYRLDQKNLFLLPTNYEVARSEPHNQELVINVSDFLSHIASNTLDALKTERMEQDMRTSDKYGKVFFKKEFSEINFNSANISDAFFNNLITYPGWKPVRLWVKRDDGDTIIIEWKDEERRIQFQQLCEFNDIFISWRGDPINGSSASIRVKRNASTKAPFYTDMISPLTYGYMALNPYEDYQRKAAMQNLIKEGSRLPDPPHFAEIACRKMMKELGMILPVDFIRGKYPAASEFIEKFARWEIPATINSGFKRFSRAIALFHSIYPNEDIFYPKADEFIKEFEKLNQKIKAFNYRNREFKDKVAVYYKQFPEREIKANRWINKILDKISPPDIQDNPKYSLKTKNKYDMEKKYPDFLKRLKVNINELHSQARMISDLFNNKLHPRLMSNILSEFTGKTFTDDEVRSFTTDFRRLQNNILAVTPDRFQIFEERYAKDGKLVGGCFKDDAEKLLFSPGDIAFTTIDDKHKFIYTQKIPNDDIFKQIAIHESDHINNGLDFAYTPPEVYIETYNTIKKFTFRGIEQYGKELLSDRNHLVDYLMRDSEFLERFCDQLMRHTQDFIHRDKIWEFVNQYLGKDSYRYHNRFSDEATKKRIELRSLMDIAYNNHKFLLYFLKQNADFMVSLWHRVAEVAYENLEPNQKIDKDALIKFDLLKSIVLQAGTALLDEVNAGASTSKKDAANSG
ncbi:hypothetical protein [Pantoea sp.]|uniref:hypothetical protein n=1 Tax=Pantoea sp. TaxID=69393 RepID=UPI0028B20B86|nr:hypothetical protein [Pantoea sp.]